ncbi:hypothetical protein DEJ51_31245 [Streptomyces venezuelae]|uniref:Uncharacterized protein n=1 Tax=Streptomyces venezuelae TaxID=54571 RepID=A0A5P2DZN4_STRVZ|nr:hypothetical protein DEJ51_31245 [Streptomyces venezuelae]
MTTVDGSGPAAVTEPVLRTERFKVFLRAAPSVGTTYRMLDEAHHRAGGAPPARARLPGWHVRGVGPRGSQLGRAGHGSLTGREHRPRSMMRPRLACRLEVRRLVVVKAAPARGFVPPVRRTAGSTWSCRPCGAAARAGPGAATGPRGSRRAGP